MANFDITLDCIKSKSKGKEESVVGLATQTQFAPSLGLLGSGIPWPHNPGSVIVSWATVT